MANRKNGPRHGSMQFWPRQRADKFLLRVNWDPLLKSPSPANMGKTNFMGFIVYKAGMKSAFVKDSTPDSMTKNKRIILPVTILECPPMKIFSVRFYKNGKVNRELINENADKELKRVVKLPKNPNIKEAIEKINEADFDDIRVIVYSQAKKTGIKKAPDITEIAISGNKSDKLKFVKENLAREISAAEVFSKGLVDIRGLTIGKGNQGAVKRFGIDLRQHKSEKGVRRVGSVGAWHPTGVKFRVPRMGQMGFHSRIVYNGQVIAVKKAGEAKLTNIVNYGDVNIDYIVLRGSVQGPKKRQLLLTPALRPTKKQAKQNYELLELR